MIWENAMKLPRRKFLNLAASAAALPIVSRIATAQSYPMRPVRVVVGFPPGGLSDLYARLIAQWLSERLGQQFIVENRTGAGGSLATESVVRAAPDGYTLLLTGNNDAFNTALYDNLKFDYLRDIAPVASITLAMEILVVNPSFPAKSVPEFMAYAKSNPGKVGVGSGGVGSGSHVAWLLFNMLSGVETVHIPYRGEGPALTDLLGGQLQAVFPFISPAIEYIRSGRLRPLAVTGAARAEVLPDVPTLKEFVPDYESIGFIGIGAPINTPPDVIDILNRTINAGLADPGLKRRITELGDAAFPSSPVQFSRFIAEFTDKWGKVMRAANVKAL
jgi:tripartite-type tricarboxylate transporter receptor subunit TctC